MDSSHLRAKSIVQTTETTLLRDCTRKLRKISKDGLQTCTKLQTFALGESFERHALFLGCLFDLLQLESHTLLLFKRLSKQKTWHHGHHNTRLKSSNTQPNIKIMVPEVPKYHPVPLRF